MPYGYAPECMGASAFCVYETQVETYGKDLANSNRSTPLSESRARNLSSPVFVVPQQYGRHVLGISCSLSTERKVGCPKSDTRSRIQHSSIRNPSSHSRISGTNILASKDIWSPGPT